MGFEPYNITLFVVEELDRLITASADEITKFVKSFELFIERKIKGENNTHNNESIPFLPRAESQYLVDYPNKMLYFFNVPYYEKYCHFTFDLIPNVSKLIGKCNSQLNTDAPRYFHGGDEEDEHNYSTLFDVGLCIGDNKIFSVYGQAFHKQQFWDSDEIYYYDISKKQWVKPKIVLKKLSSGEKMVPRHGVTCNYVHFPNNLYSKHLLYTFGGETSNQSENQTKVIMNVIEFFILDFASNQFEYFMVDKKSFLRKEIWYIPYFHSLCFETEGKLLIFGGEHYEDSSYEDNFQSKVFCFE